MRTSRKLLLPQDGGTVHKCWRAHNKEFLLDSDEVKKLYLENTFRALAHQSTKANVAIHAYCVMSNHVHESMSYAGKSEDLSNQMRIAHGRFGLIFNKAHKRQGAVAYDRPKTPVIQPDSWHQMRVHFYIEANPLRAKMVRNLKNFKYSSYRFYAWGIKDEFSSQLTLPDWYLKLGKTAKERQARYRSLFDAYLKEVRIRSALFTQAKFIGDPSWMLEQRENFRSRLTLRPKPT